MNLQTFEISPLVSRRATSRYVNRSQMKRSVTQDRWKLEINGVINKYKQEVSAQTTKINEFKQALEKYTSSTAKARSPSPYVLAEHNKQLQASIVSKEAELSAHVHTVSDHLALKIIKVERETHQLTKKLEATSKARASLERTRQEFAEIEALQSQQTSLQTQLHQLQQSISEYTSASIRKEDFGLIQSQMEQLRQNEHNLRSENDTLQTHLNELIIANNKTRPSSEKEVESAAHDMEHIFAELSTLLTIIKTLKQSESVDILALLKEPPKKHLPFASALAEAKTKVTELRTILADLYAEQCGQACITQ